MHDSFKKTIPFFLFNRIYLPSIFKVSDISITSFFNMNEYLKLFIHIILQEKEILI